MMAASLSIDRTPCWCSDGIEIGCDNGERIRIACTLDCCDPSVTVELHALAGAETALVDGERELRRGADGSISSAKSVRAWGDRGVGALGFPDQ